jgi:hypothetical protein
LAAAIKITNGKGGVIAQNKIYGFDTGIELDTCEDIDIFENDIVGKTLPRQLVDEFVASAKRGASSASLAKEFDERFKVYGIELWKWVGRGAQVSTIIQLLMKVSGH